MPADYERLRRLGAWMILAAAQRMAKETGVELVSTKIDDGGEIIEREPHLLHLATANDSVKVELSDESLVAFPQEFGIGPTLSNIRKGLSALLEPSGNR